MQLSKPQNRQSYYFPKSALCFGAMLNNAQKPADTFKALEAESVILKNSTKEKVHT